MNLAFAAERIKTWPLERLQPHAKNAKAHGADQVAKLAASMVEFGWTVPCLVAEDGELIAGHGRGLGGTQLGLTDAPVIVSSGCSAVTDCSAETRRSRPMSNGPLGSVSPSLMVTDPPFGVEYDPSWRRADARQRTLGRRPQADDALADHAQ
jgi:hypothetical protein